MDTTPSKGLNTWIGYIGAAISALSAAAIVVLNSMDVTSLPPWLAAALLALAALQERLVGKTRSEQAQTLTIAASKEKEAEAAILIAGAKARAASASNVVSPDEYRGQASISDAGPMTPGDLDAVDQADAELLPAQEG